MFPQHVTGKIYNFSNYRCTYTYKGPSKRVHRAYQGKTLAVMAFTSL